MDKPRKKQKLCDSGLTLQDICKWNSSNNVAIEYYEVEREIFITYAEVDVAKNVVSNTLRCLKNIVFIGLNPDIPEYCLPSLMLGILSSDYGFVNLPIEFQTYNELLLSLNLTYVFAAKRIDNAEVICQINVHQEHIYLLKFERVEEKIRQYNTDHHYAYAITTSGTMGTCKVVKVPHSCILPNIIDMKKILQVTEHDKIAQLTNRTFDPSIVEIFLSLSSSATLFMVSKQLKNDANRLLERMVQSRVSILQMTPSLFLYSLPIERLRDTILNKDTPLRILLLGGEPFPKFEVLTAIKHPENATRIFNIYGITEVSCWASINEIKKESLCADALYLGPPLLQTEMQVRDDKGNAVSKGTGFLYIGSKIRVCDVGDEFNKDAQNTIFRRTGDIVNIDDNGKIFYHGRENSIIKRFGNKLDLQILEKTVLELSFVHNCHALWNEMHHKLNLFFFTAHTKHLDVRNNIMKHLEKLPPLYKPDEIHSLENIQLTPNGKICPEFLKRLSVQQERASKISVSAQPHKAQEIFQNIWTTYLTLEDSGFLKQGGTSITALQISVAASKALETELPELIGMLLRDATLQNCLSYVSEKMLISNKKGSTRNIVDTIANKIEVSVTKDIPDKLEVSIREEAHRMISKEKTISWYKCKGQIYANAQAANQCSVFKHVEIPRIEVLTSFNLEKCVDASPAIIQYPDGKSYASVGSHSGIICTIQLEDSNIRKSYKIKLADRIEASILILDDLKGIVGCHDGCIYCLCLKTGDTLWKHKTGSIVKCTAIACKLRRKVYIGSYDTHVYCLSVEDGSVMWSVMLGQGSISASGCLHSQLECVLFGTLDGSCAALEESTGKVVWKRKLSDPIFVAPVVLKNGLVLFCSVAGTLVCYDIRANVEIWKYIINGNVFSYLVLTKNLATDRENIILASQNKYLYRLELDDTVEKTGPDLKYTIKFSSPVFATPWCENGMLYVVSTDGTLSIYNFADGGLLTTLKLPGEAAPSRIGHANNSLDRSMIAEHGFISQLI
ncbi:hypothetical protein KM043_005674 [Ampulex compressa]|nr:hypothetical protein KM043_005674 [Ampulex compressa]